MCLALSALYHKTSFCSALSWPHLFTPWLLLPRQWLSFGLRCLCWTKIMPNPLAYFYNGLLPAQEVGGLLENSHPNPFPWISTMLPLFFISCKVVVGGSRLGFETSLSLGCCKSTVQIFCQEGRQFTWKLFLFHLLSKPQICPNTGDVILGRSDGGPMPTSAWGKINIIAWNLYTVYLAAALPVWALPTGGGE